MSPLKNKEQVLKNYKKNKDLLQADQVRGHVSDNHKEQLFQILNEDQPPDPTSTSFEVMSSRSLNEIQPAMQVTKGGRACRS